VKPLSSLLVLALFGTVGATYHLGLPGKEANQASNPRARTPVVLELFTSEGCSSCPPADALLARLEEQQPIPGAEIIALEEHVDYWDHEGWVDPFSSEQWTLRQQAYASTFSDHGVYTPELVINGRTGFVGSREREARRNISEAASQPQTEVMVTLAKSEKRDSALFNVSVAKILGAQAGDTAEIWLAVTETALHSAVTRGENAGEDLHHAAVVRWLHKAGTADGSAVPAFAGHLETKLDAGWKRANLRVVAFVQEKRSRHILGAASARIEP